MRSALYFFSCLKALWAAPEAERSPKAISSLLAPYDKSLGLCIMLSPSFVASRPKAAPPTSRPGGPILKLARGVAVSTGGAYAPEQLKGEGE